MNFRIGNGKDWWHMSSNSMYKSKMMQFCFVFLSKRSFFIRWNYVLFGKKNCRFFSLFQCTQLNFFPVAWFPFSRDHFWNARKEENSFSCLSFFVLLSKIQWNRSFFLLQNYKFLKLTSSNATKKKFDNM